MCLILSLFVSIGFSQEGSEINISPNDERAYKHLVLSNGLPVILVSDKDAEKSSAALAVKVGSYQDPKAYPGLAHFLEHMLFLGTKTYPGEGEFSKYIQQFGGFNNATTAFERTTYYFDIQPKGLRGALHRLSRFFIDPTFDKKFIQREIKAVDSEYRRYLKNDDMRSYYILKAILPEKHPITKFHVGNLNSLVSFNPNELRENVISFYHQYYHPDNMNLVVYGPQSLELLEQWVKAYFAVIPSNSKGLSTTQPPMIHKIAPRQKQVQIKSIGKRRELEVTFIVPNPKLNYQVRPLDYITTILMQKHKGSLYDKLYKKGLIESVSAGGFALSDQEFIYSISFTLSKEGLGDVDTIVSDTFAFLRMLQDKGVEQWRYDELSQLSALKYKFIEKKQPYKEALWLVKNMSHFSLSDVVWAGKLYKQYDEKVIRRYLNKLKPEKCNIFLIHPDAEVSEQEPHYRAEYSVLSIDEARIKQWQESTLPLSLAKPNDYMSHLLDGTKVFKGEDSPMPQKLVSEKGLASWLDVKTMYKLPETQVSILCVTSKLYDSIARAAITPLYTNILQEKIHQHFDEAIRAGYQISVQPVHRGLALSVKGYSTDKLKDLVKSLMAYLHQFDVSTTRFDLVKSKLLRQYENQAWEEPFYRLGNIIRFLTISKYYELEQLVEKTKSITLPELLNFRTKDLKFRSYEVLVFGNADAQYAKKLVSAVTSGGQKVTPLADKPSWNIVNLPSGKPSAYNMKTKNPNAFLSAIYQSEESGMSGWAKMAILTDILREPFFSELRTNQQLGYIVDTGSYLFKRGIDGLYTVIQSPKFSSDAIYTRQNKFFEEFAKTLEKLEDSDFRLHQKAIINDLLAKPVNFTAAHDRVWYEIERGYYQFDYKKELATVVETIKPVDLLSYFTELTGEETRKLLLVKTPEVTPIEVGIEINNVEGFKRSVGTIN